MAFAKSAERNVRDTLSNTIVVRDYSLGNARGLLREFEPAKGAGSQDSLESSGSGIMLRKELKRAG